jgi:hypothetical protein
MKNYGFRGFLIAFSLFFILTFKSCKGAYSGTEGTDFFSLTIIAIIVGAILGAVGLLIGKQFKTSKELDEIELFKKYKKLVLILIPSTLILLYFFGRYNTMFDSNKISDTLINNLTNLNGEWSYHNTKQNENWWLQICYNDETKKGTYVLSNKSDSWGENKNQDIKTINQGSFDLIEGYDGYGEKAYVGRDVTMQKPIFLITQLENNYGMDWLLKISLIESDMFGEKMTKIGNECK